MKHTNTDHTSAVSQSDYDQERWVLDYINGHLSHADKLAFEKQLAASDALQALLEQTQDWQKTLHASQATQRYSRPDFTQIEHKLTRKKGVWFMPVIPVAFACMLVFTFAELLIPANQQFDTLTQAPLRQEAMLQLILAPNTDSEAVIERYNLQVIESFSNQRILNVALTQDIQNIKDTLRTDKHILMLKELGQSK